MSWWVSNGKSDGGLRILVAPVATVELAAEMFWRTYPDEESARVSPVESTKEDDVRWFKRQLPPKGKR